MDAGTIFDDRPRAENLPHLLSGINMEYIGETHQALEQELDYQTFLESELKSRVSRGLYSQQDAANLQMLIDLNREHLESLSPITSLEHIFSQITQKISDRAVDLVNFRDNPAFWDRNLSKNVRNCWKTVQRFSYISRVHISNAAEYQMFYYNCDHFVKSLEKKIEVSYNRSRSIDLDYPSVTTNRLNSLMTESLSSFQSMAADVMRLLDKAKHINPVYLRLRPLNRPASGIMLCDYSTKNFSLRTGQHVYVLDNATGSSMATSSAETEESESISVSSCSRCCHHQHPGCANCGQPLSSTTGTTTTTTEITGESAMTTDSNWQESDETPGDVSEVSTTAGSSPESGDESTAHACSHTLCSQREPLMWKVRTLDGSLTVDVPAVTVMINEADEEAISHAYEIYDHFTNMWRESIDIWLTKGVRALTGFFSNLLESKYVRVESQKVFEQLLEEVQRAFPYSDAESGTANLALKELITSLKEKIRRQETREESTEDVFVKITEIASYRKTVQKLRDHANHMKRFMKEADESTKPGHFETTSLKSMGELNYVYEESVEEHRKLEKMLRQVNAFRTQPRSTRVPVRKINTIYGEYYSSGEEMSSSGSETSDSQYDVQRHPAESPRHRIIYGKDMTHRVTALTDRPRHMRGPHRSAVFTEGEDLPTDSSDLSDTGTPRRSSKVLLRPLHRRPTDETSEVVEETNDTVISSMTLKRKLNLEKAMRQGGQELPVSPTESRYRSRRQLQFKPGPQDTGVSIVYLQITTAKSTQDTIAPADDNKQSRGIQLDIEKIPVDGKEVLMVEQRVASWQPDEDGTMRLEHDISLDASKRKREMQAQQEGQTAEVIVSGLATSPRICDRGVQITSGDKYEGIMKPPHYNTKDASTQAKFKTARDSKEVLKSEKVQTKASTEAETLLGGEIPILRQTEETRVESTAPTKEVTVERITVKMAKTQTPVLKMHRAYRETEKIQTEPQSLIRKEGLPMLHTVPPLTSLAAQPDEALTTTRVEHTDVAVSAPKTEV
uniref:SH3_10 domain-containing protein n=3 Tax=Mesocestoides corti TaxID=53468 RepID=A0A5K3FQK0_MESCO